MNKNIDTRKKEKEKNHLSKRKNMNDDKQSLMEINKYS